MEEETGYKADPDNVRKLISIITAVAFCNEKVDIYVADKLTKSVQQLDEEEYINVEYYTLQELKDMIMNVPVIIWMILIIIVLLLLNRQIGKKERKKHEKN